MTEELRVTWRGPAGTFTKRVVDGERPMVLQVPKAAPRQIAAKDEPPVPHPVPQAPELTTDPGAAAATADIEDDLAEFFGPRADRYLRIYRKGGWMSWNWGVFFFGFVWFFYRKQYAAGFAVLFLPVALALVAGWLELGALSVAPLGFTIAMVVMADRLYINHAVKQVARVDADGLTGEERAEALQDAGGVSWFAGGLAAIPYLVINLLVVAFVYAILSAMP